MEILWWLVPPVVVTVVAMLWVGWLGRDGHGAVDRDAAVEKMARALRKEHPGIAVRPPSSGRPRDRSTGIAVRPSSGRAAAAEDRRTA